MTRNRKDKDLVLKNTWQQHTDLIRFMGRYKKINQNR